MSTKPWYLYIAESASGKYYVGITTDVDVRLQTHNSGKGSVMGRIDGPLILRFVSSELETQGIARSLEIRIKKISRSKKQEIISGVTDLSGYLVEK